MRALYRWFQFWLCKCAEEDRESDGEGTCLNCGGRIP